ncbi:hypothetical protein WAI453_001761 [Rhynchosporium graminicola]
MIQDTATLCTLVARISTWESTGACQLKLEEVPSPETSRTGRSLQLLFKCVRKVQEEHPSRNQSNNGRLLGWSLGPHPDSPKVKISVTVISSSNGIDEPMILLEESLSTSLST